MSKTLELPEEIYKNTEGRWCKLCPSCNIEQSYLRRNYAYHSFMANKECKACSNSKIENCHRGWYKGVRISWFNKYKTSAERRGIEFNLTIEEIADIMEIQKFKCFMTGWDLNFPETGSPQNTDASIDRIDNSVGYVKDNVHIVHKWVNMMRGKYQIEDFVNVCKAVSDKVKW